MTTDADKALQLETEFLSGVGANFEAAKGRHFRGTIWNRVAEDEEDALRRIMAEKRKYDRSALRKLPSNRRVTIHGFEKRFVFFKRRTGVAVASVLTPMEHFVAPSGDAPPIGLGELMAHVRKLVTDGRTQHIIGVCSPTGFTEEARQARPDQSNVTLVLIEPETRGGWKVHGTSDTLDPRLVKIFDPEGPKQKVERIRDLIDDSSVDLLTGGLSASAVALRSNLPEDVVRQSFEALALHDPELRVTREDEELILYRGAPVSSPEKKLGMIDRIRQLFAGEGDEKTKINALAERRAALARRRDRIYDDIAKLEDREAQLLEQGKAAKSQVPRRRLAAQLAQLRKDIARQNTTAAMLNQQINIISTDIHNLTLLQQGEMAQLPSTEQLTENAVRAEEMLETLKADADMVASLESGIEANVTSAEEEAILREFEQADRDAEAEPKRTAPAPRAKEAAPQSRAEPDSGVAEDEPSLGGRDEPPSKRRDRDAEAS